jgi:hypothetical protein
MHDRKNDTAIGILNDWDMASLLDLLGDATLSTARHRTGTVPFMAMELLHKNPPAHLYRHDLESFFYILIWAAIHYDIPHKKHLSTTNLYIAGWDSDLHTSSMNKSSFFFDPITRREILSAIRPEFKELETQWIQPLTLLFQLGKQFNNYPGLAPVQPYDPTTYGGQVTLQTFMAALGREPRTLVIHPIQVVY